MSKMDGLLLLSYNGSGMSAGGWRINELIYEVHKWFGMDRLIHGSISSINGLELDAC